MSWRVSQLREMFNWSLNGIWQWVHNWGLDHGGDYSPLSRSALLEEVSRIPTRAIAGLQWNGERPIGAMLSALRRAAEVTGRLDDAWMPTAKVSELKLVNASEVEGDPARQLAAFLALNLLTLVRIADPELPAAVGPGVWRHVQEGGRLRIGLEYALRQLRRDLDADMTLNDVARRIVWDQVVVQHERVALSKLPEDTFRWHVENEQIRFIDQPTGFGMNDPRFGSLATITSELGWCTPPSEPGHALSAEGEELRTRGTLPALELAE